MNPDGSDKLRLTDFNNPALPTFKNRSIVAADASFSPDGRFLIAYLQVNLVTQEGVTVLIESKMTGSGGDSAWHERESVAFSNL